MESLPTSYAEALSSITDLRILNTAAGTFDSGILPKSVIYHKHDDQTHKELIRAMKSCAYSPMVSSAVPFIHEVLLGVTGDENPGGEVALCMKKMIEALNLPSDKVAEADGQGAKARFETAYAGVKFEEIARARTGGEEEDQTQASASSADVLPKRGIATAEIGSWDGAWYKTVRDLEKLIDAKGLKEEEGTMILIHLFLGCTLGGIKDPVKISDYVAKTVPRMLNNMNGISIPIPVKISTDTVKSIGNLYSQGSERVKQLVLAHVSMKTGSHPLANLWYAIVGLRHSMHGMPVVNITITAANKLGITLKEYMLATACTMLELSATTVALWLSKRMAPEALAADPLNNFAPYARLMDQNQFMELSSQVQSCALMAKVGIYVLDMSSGEGGEAIGLAGVGLPSELEQFANALAAALIDKYRGAKEVGSYAGPIVIAAQKAASNKDVEASVKDMYATYKKKHPTQTPAKAPEAKPIPKVTVDTSSSQPIPARPAPTWMTAVTGKQGPSTGSAQGPPVFIPNYLRQATTGQGTLPKSV